MELASLKSRFTQEIESYKVKLKKSEFIFQKEYEATSELIFFISNLLPTYRHPDMDWQDACDDMACKFDSIETDLKSYLSRHGAVLNEEVRLLVYSCVGTAGENKFEIGKNRSVSTTANQAADDLYEKLKKAEKILLKQIHSQSSLV